ncbi:hypothetical protein NITGR_250030 [Nitrospina gracilis 3/211]|uniref:Uncharacterized protein n=1 Tax=Nitrospina gracilis (strain 3/211) TaxID=1266370 RepID=M1ZA68_NITG3|nr:MULTISPECIES: hypothetical protein [Nitrospina]MCF8723080.1 NADH:ubiquinone oxidoreductase subunit E [Nitrospina sp. Nb-3]CCQ90117.1 hypothetical protein NITGR_250030 [Nitrospina gracilis 3/211]
MELENELNQIAKLGEREALSVEQLKKHLKRFDNRKIIELLRSVQNADGAMSQS